MSTRANLWQRLWTPLLTTALGRALIRHIARPIDRALLPLTKGRLTFSRLFYPTLLLTTTGARSGQPRSTPLIYFRDGTAMVLVASNYGEPRHPAWYHNLRATPRALVTADGATAPYLAREAEGAEREELWRKALAFYGGYEAYSRRAGGRRIPIMVLDPVPA
jgi:deazaflavin-dependent oxidoreductase (nitroreductase family)